MTVLDKILLQKKAYYGNSVGKIVNGDFALEGEYPYAAALFNEGFSFCGGSLITPSVVLTSASCIFNQNITVRLGCTQLSSDDCEVIEVVQTFTHPDFQDFFPFPENDVALLVLDTPSTQETAQLPSASLSADAFVNLPTFEIGWGNDDPVAGSFDFSDFLKESQSVVIENSICDDQSSSINELIYSFDTTIFDSMICSVGNSQGPCDLDTGGPLIVKCDGTDNDLTIGVTLQRDSCGFSGFPNYFARTFTTSAFNFIVEAVTSVGEINDLEFVSDLNDFCQDGPVTVSPIPPTPFPTINVEGWICSGFYGVRDGCDCECGIPDPDCEFDQETFFCGGNDATNCSPEQIEECINTITPTKSPVTGTDNPTDARFPTFLPTRSPTVGPTNSPTVGPTKSPSFSGGLTNSPTSFGFPTVGPTVNPTSSGNVEDDPDNDQFQDAVLIFLGVIVCCVSLICCCVSWLVLQQIFDKRNTQENEQEAKILLA